MDSAAELFTNTTFSIIFAILVVMAVLTFVLPLVVYCIYRQLIKQGQLLSKMAENESSLHQTKLLTEIRDALRAMEAVGVEAESETEPMLLPPIRNPRSVDPARERLRRP